MKPFTLVMAYYDNPRMLGQHQRLWDSLPPDILEQLHVIIVDDGSPHEPAEGAFLKGLRTPASTRLYRIDIDIPWNQDAARNIGVHEAATDWVLLTDMDHLVPEATWRYLLDKDLSPVNAYRFGRVTAPAMTPYKPHPNSWLMTCKTFWKVGGYDERLAGNYGTDGDVLNRIRAQGRLWGELPVPLVRVPRDHIPDASTRTLERKNPDEKRRVNELIGQRNAAALKPLHFQFPFHRVW